MDEMAMIVSHGMDLPTPGKVLLLGSALSGSKYTAKVKTIVGMRWHKNGRDLIITFTYSNKKVYVE